MCGEQVNLVDSIFFRPGRKTRGLVHYPDNVTHWPAREPRRELVEIWDLSVRPIPYHRSECSTSFLCTWVPDLDVVVKTPFSEEGWIKGVLAISCCDH